MVHILCDNRTSNNTLIQEALGCECSDPRDRIYANLGIFSGRFQVLIIPDYRKSVNQVYQDFFPSRVDYFHYVGLRLLRF